MLHAGRTAALVEARRRALILLVFARGAKEAGLLVLFVLEPAGLTYRALALGGHVSSLARVFRVRNSTNASIRLVEEAAASITFCGGAVSKLDAKVPARSLVVLAARAPAKPAM